MKVEVVSIKLFNNSNLVKDASKRAIKNALEAIGMSAVRHAASICPVDTGNLRNSIKYKLHTNENAVYFGTKVDYGKYVELGHYNVRSGKHVAARPFIKPAATDHKSEYKTIAKKYLTEA